MNLTLLEGVYAIYQFRTGSELPPWIWSSPFYSITGTPEEISVVAGQRDPGIKEIKSDRGWKILKIDGPLDFSLIGIISDISGIMKKMKIPVFIISTYDTDYILIKEEKLKSATDALLGKGYRLAKK